MAASSNQKLSFWKRGPDKVPGSAKPIYGARYPPLQHPLNESTMHHLSKVGTPEKPKKMTFESFAGKTADAWEIEEGLSGLSLDSALERHSSPIANDVPQPEALTTKVEVDFDVSSHFLQNVRPRTQSSMTPPARTKDKDSSEGSSRARTQSHSQPLHKGKKSKGHGSTKSTRSPQLEHQKSPPLSQHFMEDSLDLVDSESTRLEKFGKLLAGPSTDIGQLKKLSWSGIPPAVRATTWQILLGYLPSNIDRREETIARKRREYRNLIAQYYHTREDELYANTFRQIHIDVPRMNPKVPLFQQDLCQRTFERILYIWSIRRPASGYVQGINDLVTPFFVVFLGYYIPGYLSPETFQLSKLSEEVLNNLEADSFWCMSQMLDKIQDNYTFAQPGIQKGLLNIENLVKRIDGSLHKHLQDRNIEYLQFAFRWINNLLMRELPLRLVIRLWDTYLSEGDDFPEFHTYVCVALLLKFSTRIQAQDDFQHTMMLLQNLPTDKWEDSDIQILLAEAYKLKAIYGHARGHLRQDGHDAK